MIEISSKSIEIHGKTCKNVKNQSDCDCLSTASINKHLSAISAILSWAEKNGYFESNPQWNNPVTGLSITKRGAKTTRLPMDQDDLNLLFKSLSFLLI